MKPCRCGGRDIAVTALVVDRVRIGDDGELEFVDIGQPGDAGEWSHDASVTCLRCGRVLPYSEWSNQDE